MQSDEAPKLTATISIDIKRSNGNYGADGMFMGVSNITVDTTEEEIDLILDGPAKIAYAAIVARFKERFGAARNYLRENG